MKIDYNYLAENASDPVIVIDKRRLIRYCNNASLASYGFSKKEFMGKDFLKILPIEYHAAAKDAFRRVLNGGSLPKLYLESFNKKHARKYIEVNAKPYIEKRTIIGILMASRDITDRVDLAQKIESRNEQIVRLSKKVDSSAFDLLYMDNITHNIISGDLNAIINDAITTIMKKTGAESCSVMLIKKDEQVLETKCIKRAYPKRDKSVIEMKIGEGAAGFVAKTGQSLEIDNKLNHKRYTNFGTSSYKKGAYLGIPIKYRDEILGVLNLDFKEPHIFNEETRQFLKLVTNYLSIAVFNSKLNYEYKRKVDRLSALYDITSAMNATLNLDKVLDLIVVKIVKLLNAKICVVMLLNEDKTKLVPKTFYLGADVKLETVDVKDSLSGKAVIEKKITYCELSDQEDYEFKDQLSKLKINNLLCIPLRLEDHVIGTINIYSRSRYKYTEGEYELLMSLADGAALAIEKAILYKKIERDRDNLKAIMSISQFTSSSLDIDMVMKLLLQKTVEFTHAKTGAILIIRKGYLKMKYQLGYPRQKAQKIQVKIGSGIVGWAFKHKRPLIIGDVMRDDRYIKIVSSIRSEAAFPIIFRGKVTGILNLDSDNINNFERYQAAVAILLSNVAIALENAKLHQRQKNFNIRLKHEVAHATKDLVEANKRLKKLDELKSEFVSNVSHELRTPLTSIKGYSALLYSNRVGEISKDQKECLKIVIDETDRLTRLINDVLDVSKLESQKVQMTLENIDLKPFLEEVLTLLTPQAKEKNIDLYYDCPDTKLRIDKDKIKQVFNNLISNAIKFTYANGRIDILVKDLPQYVQIAVKDTGKGIPKDKIGKLFDKFYQVDPVLTKTTPGTGLGLVIAKHIVELHKGRIWVESDVKRGSTFYFTINKKII